jgi:hypothetical protein
MLYFIYGDAIRSKHATQQEDTGAQVQVFVGVFVGLLRIAAAPGVTVFVFPVIGGR